MAHASGHNLSIYSMVILSFYPSPKEKSYNHTELKLCHSTLSEGEALDLVVKNPQSIAIGARKYPDVRQNERKQRQEPVCLKAPRAVMMRK